ncbi:MAG: arginine--tRNA ligase [Myxococcales bacterium]|nr:arginine--tRNA ligase [Myxococcales bacterium]
MRERLHQQLRDIVQALLDEAGSGGEVPEFVLEAPRSDAHGDFACNAAMLLAKLLRQPPRTIAERIANRLLETTDWVERVEVAGPGFVNFWLAGSRWHALLRRVLEAGPRYGHADVGKDQRVQVEFVSANPTGPLTLGHGRNAVLGDSIARLLEALGFEVTREYYFNDAGRQMRVLGDSVRARYLEALGRAAPPPQDALSDPEQCWRDEIGGLPVVFPRDGYQGDYIVEIAQELREKHGEALVEEPGDGKFREAAQARIFEEIHRTLEGMGIVFDVYSNEKDLYAKGRLDEVLDALREENLVYEEEGATWLRASALGLDRDRVLVKRTGEPTYLLPDIAYHREKLRRGFDRVIDVLGADHIEQFPFVREAIRALGYPHDHLELVMHQFVTLTSGGEQLKQSTRRANYVTVDELLADVGVDVFRFFMVQRRAESHLDFDLDLARERDWKKNPAYYVQYACARTHGIERKARELGVAMPDAATVDPSPLVLPEEIEILRKISEFPELVERAGATREPHHVAYYARDMAGLWNPYVQDGARHRVLSEDEALTNARLGLALGVRTVLANALALLGISAPEQM